MKKIFYSLMCILFCVGFSEAFAQGTQTVRGKILDAASKAPIIGVNVYVVGSDPIIGSASDENGSFRLEKVPVGRVSLKAAFVGYEDIFIKDLIVNAGKEVILDLSMTESLTSLDEVTVTYQRSDDERVTNNEMVTLSAKPFNPSETLKYAGSFGDPSRMAANFAGVNVGNDSRNDIVVRGNSPASLLWRMEGVNIPNPNHFGSLGTSGGPVSMVNANLLAKSDFLMGAFPAEYSNALGSVFDLKLRKGNDEKREYLAQVAFNGAEVGAEGPYSKKSKASFLINYRYSIFALMSNIGFKIAGTPYYQDFTFKTDMPVGKRGTFSLWTLGGTSRITFLGKDVSTDGDAYGNESENSNVKFFAGIGAMSYEHRFTDKTYGKITLSASRSSQNYNADTVVYKDRFGKDKEIASEAPREQAEFINEKMSVNLALSHKFNAKHKISLGSIIDFSHFNLRNTDLIPTKKELVNSDGNTMLAQGYFQWKYRMTENLTMNAGVNGMYYQLNKQAVVEPRLGFNYALTEKSTLSIGYGLHSNIQPVLMYFYQNKLADGTYVQSNKDLNFTRSHHFVAGYERSLGKSLRLKVEGYYQSLFDVPIENSKSSYYAALVEGSDFNPPSVGFLANKGTGSNVGVEITLEKSFSNNYYFLVTTSLFDSKYKGSDGIERNTPFNSKYVFNILAGKEFKIGKNGDILSINWKFTAAGGRFIRTVDLAKSAQADYTIYDDARTYTEQQKAYLRTDLKISFKMNRKNITHEIALDLQNFTNNQNVFQQAYNPRTQKIGTAYQQGFLPIPFYRMTF
ncbi:MAG: TonB-dependent receptor [Bacteroidetes bacterium]|nr:MAG: TonB-dependent receptor [Bacteroidota bacterium]